MVLSALCNKSGCAHERSVGGWRGRFDDAPARSQEGLQRLAGVAVRTGRDLLRRAHRDDLPALVPGVRAQVYQPVGGLDDLEVMLNDEHGVAGIHQALEDL